MYDIDKIVKLSQEEGMNDRQISEKLGCSRVTITRIRKRNNIPRFNKRNAKDKKYVCLNCGQTVYIRRKQHIQAFCPKCLAKLKNNNTN